MRMPMKRSMEPTMARCSITGTRRALSSATNSAPERVLEVVLDLGPVERALARQLGPFRAARAQRRAQRLLGLVPLLLAADALRGAQRDLHLHLLEAEVAVDLERELVEGHALGLDLRLGAEDVAVVLREAAHAHESVQRARRLVAVAGAEFAVAQRQVAVAP